VSWIPIVSTRGGSRRGLEPARVSVFKHGPNLLLLMVRLRLDALPKGFVAGATVEVSFGQGEHDGLLRLALSAGRGYKLRRNKSAEQLHVFVPCPPAYATDIKRGRPAEIRVKTDDEIVLVLPSDEAAASKPTAKPPAEPKPAKINPHASERRVVTPPAAEAKPAAAPKPAPALKPAAPAPAAPAPVKSAAVAGSYAIDARLFEPLLDTIDMFSPHDAAVRRVREAIATARNRAGKAASVSVYLERVDVGCLAPFVGTAAKNARFDQRVQDLAKGLLERLGGVS
jgi:hypothetical protein